MTSIVVGFVDRPEGHAALARAIAEASRRGVRLVVAHGRPEAAGIGGGQYPTRTTRRRTWASPWPA